MVEFSEKGFFFFSKPKWSDLAKREGFFLRFYGRIFTQEALPPNQSVESQGEVNAPGGSLPLFFPDGSHETSSAPNALR